MIVSWQWLSQYVDLDMSHDELVDRLTMSGLNHEGTEPFGDDHAIDLEVTSNRPDCLGHIGVAREIGVLFDIPLKLPQPQPATISDKVSDHVSIQIDCPDKCERYTARLIRGVKIGPSPDWLVKRLQAATARKKFDGTVETYQSVNNVVDVTNYVMFECGQPLHAFDFAKIDGGKIVVRDANADETFTAIDHRDYSLNQGMCLIADPKKPLAIAGVMGGAESEVSDATTDVLIESAWFHPLSVRRTARRLNLHSPSSFRFERDVDSAQLDWASRRCCELILETAGGELLDGVVDVGQPPETPPPVVLRLSQLSRILGIEIPADVVPEILKKLGMTVDAATKSEVTVTPPTFRKDVSREADLVEEVGRIYGFDKVPDDVAVPLAASTRPKKDIATDRVRRVLLAAGFDEAMTPSLVPQPWSDSFTPWTQQPALQSSQPMLGVLEKASQNIGAVDLLRRSLVPSLLEARRINEFRTNSDIELFETSKVYLNVDGQPIPDQPTMVSLVSGRDYYFVKGVVESIVAAMDGDLRMTLVEHDDALMDPDQSGRLMLGDATLGYIARASKSAMKQFRLRSDAVFAELNLQVLMDAMVGIVIHRNQSSFPPVSRDFNFIVDDAVKWSAMEKTVRANGGELLEAVDFREIFRDPGKDGKTKKRMLLSITLRADDATLTGEQADAVSSAIINGCEKEHAATLVQ